MGTEVLSCRGGRTHAAAKGEMTAGASGQASAGGAGVARKMGKSNHTFESRIRRGVQCQDDGSVNPRSDVGLRIIGESIRPSVAVFPEDPSRCHELCRLEGDTNGISSLGDSVSGGDHGVAATRPGGAGDIASPSRPPKGLLVSAEQTGFPVDSWTSTRLQRRSRG